MLAPGPGQQTSPDLHPFCSHFVHWLCWQVTQSIEPQQIAPPPSGGVHAGLPLLVDDVPLLDVVPLEPLPLDDMPPLVLEAEPPSTSRYTTSGTEEQAMKSAMRANVARAAAVRMADLEHSSERQANAHSSEARCQLERRALRWRRG